MRLPVEYRVQLEHTKIIHAHTLKVSPPKVNDLFLIPYLFLSLCCQGIEFRLHNVARALIP